MTDETLLERLRREREQKAAELATAKDLRALAAEVAELDERIADVEAGAVTCRYCGGSHFRAWYPVDEGQGIDVGRNEDGGLTWDYNGDTTSGEAGAETEYWCLSCDRSARTLEFLVGDTDEDDEPASARYSWHGWLNGEEDCDPPEPGKFWLSITEDGDELAIIVHRQWGDERDEPAKYEKEARAQRIVEALNRDATERGRT